MRVRTIIVAVLAATTVGVAAPAADAKTKKPSPRMQVISEFRVEYDAKVTWNIHNSVSTWNETSALGYTVKGTLPNLTFVDGSISKGVSRTVGTTVEGTASLERVHPDGTSATCHGKTVQVKGLAGIGRTRNGFWFAPWLSAAGLGSCSDSDGGTPPLTLKVGVPAPSKTDEIGVPPGGQEYVVPSRGMDVDDWSKPFRIPVADDKCPNYDGSMTISCSYTIEGTLTLTRVSRKEEEEDTSMDDLLAPIEPPKLDRRKTKAKAEVKCEDTCDIEAMIGVFGGTRKKPKVTPIRSKKQRLKADRATTISFPLNARARAAAKQGTLVMTLKVKGGKRQIYPLI